jgi:hypothetical protein
VSASDAAPIACTLSPGEMGPRLARIRRLTTQHLRSHRLEGTRLFLCYDGAAMAEVEHIVNLECECCAFLDFSLNLRGDELELLIAAPERAGSDAQWLFAQFLPEAASDAQTRGCACCKG